MSLQNFQEAFPTLGERVFVAESAIVIGDVSLADDVSVWPMSVIRGDVNRIEIGAGTNIQDAAILHVTHNGTYTPGGYALRIGKNVTVGHRAVLHGCSIGDHCLIGIGAIVMDGAVIDAEVMVGAGALVPPGKRLESGFLYVGAPARQARPLTEQERESLRYSARHYIRLKDQYLTQQ